MALLYLVATHVEIENPTAIEVDSAVAIKRTQIHTLIEILHLET